MLWKGLREGTVETGRIQVKMKVVYCNTCVDWRMLYWAGLLAKYIIPLKRLSMAGGDETWKGRLHEMIQIWLTSVESGNQNLQMGAFEQRQKGSMPHS